MLYYAIKAGGLYHLYFRVSSIGGPCISLLVHWGFMAIERTLPFNRATLGQVRLMTPVLKHNALATMPDQGEPPEKACESSDRATPQTYIYIYILCSFCGFRTNRKGFPPEN